MIKECIRIATKVTLGFMLCFFAGRGLGDILVEDPLYLLGIPLLFLWCLLLACTLYWWFNKREVRNGN